MSEDAEENLENGRTHLEDELGDQEEETELDRVDTEEWGMMKTYFCTSGPKGILFIVLLYAMSIGITISVVPKVTTDKFASLNHGYKDDIPCSSFDNGSVPSACEKGSDNAKDAVAVSALVSYILTFVFAPTVGTMSDIRGRILFIGIGVFLDLFPMIFLVLIQYVDSMSSWWYFGAKSLTGLVNWLVVAFSSIADVMPKKWRTSAFGFTMTAFGIGFAFSPAIAVALSDIQASFAAVVMVATQFIFVFLCQQETIPTLMSSTDSPSLNEIPSITKIITRPVKDIGIIKTKSIFKKLSAITFLSALVMSAEYTLLIYYVENDHNFQDKDVAMLMAISGIIGIFVLGVILKPLNEAVGEKYVIAIALLAGLISNLLYGIAWSKSIIVLGASILAFTKMWQPTVGAINANNVSDLEQGHIQGAFFSIGSLASAVGPLILRLVYYIFKGTSPLKSGVMFVFGSAVYGLALILTLMLPTKEIDSRLIESSVLCGEGTRTHDDIEQVSTIDLP